MSDPLAAERRVAELLLSLFGRMPTVDLDPFEEPDDEPFAALPVELDPPAPEQRAAAERHLGALVEALARADDDAARGLAIARTEGALALLVHAGLVAVGEVDGWRERVAAVVPPPAPVADDHEAQSEPAADDHEALVRTWSAPGELRAVVAAPLARHDGMCVLRVTLHERATEVAWHLVRRGRMRFVDGHALAAGFRLADDLGTEYGELAGGGGWGDSSRGGPYAVHGSSRCETPVPPDATRLTIAHGEGRWDVPLPGP